MYGRYCSAVNTGLAIPVVHLLNHVLYVKKLIRHTVDDETARHCLAAIMDV